MDIEVAKSDLHEIRVRPKEHVDLSPGQGRLRIERFGISANNITYAVMGESMRYWDFFPAREATWGRVPTWGFAKVTESAHEELVVGSRVFGYVPMSTELVITPDRFDHTGFSDVVAHRAELPRVYNRYAYVHQDPHYDPRHEGEVLLLRPLFITSFVVDDFLADSDFFGATTIIISSASSKTALAAAFLLGRRMGLHVIGLTSRSNVDFTVETDIYDEVLHYDDVSRLPLSDAIYVDVAGRPDITRQIHDHYGERLRYSMIVGDTHWDAQVSAGGPIAGPVPTLLFAPDHIHRRRREWGRAQFELAMADSWRSFVKSVSGWLKIRELHGPEEITKAYLDVLEGRIDPRLGYVCSFDD